MHTLPFIRPRISTGVVSAALSSSLGYVCQTTTVWSLSPVMSVLVDVFHVHAFTAALDEGEIESALSCHPRGKKEKLFAHAVT